MENRITKERSGSSAVRATAILVVFLLLMLALMMLHTAHANASTMDPVAVATLDNLPEAGEHEHLIMERREDEIPATCTVPGSYTAVEYCQICGEVLSRTPETIPKTGHNKVNVPRVAPTCEEDGTRKHFECTRCGKWYHRQDKTREVTPESQILPAVGHSWDSGTITKTPNCQETGIRMFTCYNDSTHTKTEDVEKSAHTPGATEKKNEVAPTCITQGSYDIVTYCEVCSHEIETVRHSVLEAHHDLEMISRVEPSCTSPGMREHYSCGKCAGSFLDGSALLPAGKAVLKLAAKGHSWDGGSITKDPGCSEVGEMTYHCLHDPEHTKTSDIDPAGHTASEPVRENEIPSGCETQGSYELVTRCGSCRKELKRESKVTPASAHSTQPVGEEPETCSAPGTKSHHICGSCGGVFLDGEGLVPVDRGELHIPSTGHEWDDGEITRDPTCSKPGIRTYTCINDGEHTMTEETGTSAHTEGETIVESEVPATCDTNGSRTEVTMCSVCDMEIHREVKPIKKTGHNWGESIVATAPTATSPGVMRYICTNDNSHIRTEECPPDVMAEESSGAGGIGETNGKSSTDHQAGVAGETKADNGDKAKPGYAVGTDSKGPTSVAGDNYDVVVTINKKTVTKALVEKTVAGTTGRSTGNGRGVKKIVLGGKVRNIKRKAFSGVKEIKTLVIKTKKLKKQTVKSSFRGSGIRKILIRTGNKGSNSRYMKKYSRIFSKRICGKKVCVLIR